MIDEFNTTEKLDELFAQGGSSARAPYLMVFSTFPTGVMMLGGAGAAMSEHIDQKFGGYLVSVGDDRLVLMPLSKLRNSNGMSAPSKMKLANAKLITLDRSHMVSFKNRPAGGIIPSMRTITIEMDNGRKYVWSVLRQDKALGYQAQGAAALEAFGQGIAKK